MGRDIRDLLITVAILMGGLLTAPAIVDRIPYVAGQSQSMRILIRVVIATLPFVTLILTWGVAGFLFRKRGGKGGTVL